MGFEAYVGETRWFPVLLQDEEGVAITGLKAADVTVNVQLNDNPAETLSLDDTAPTWREVSDTLLPGRYQFLYGPSEAGELDYQVDTTAAYEAVEGNSAAITYEGAIDVAEPRLAATWPTGSESPYGDTASFEMLVSKLSPTETAMEFFGEMARQEMDSRLATRYAMPIVKILNGAGVEVWPDPLPMIWLMLAAGLFHMEKFSTNTVGGPSAFGAELMATARRMLEEIINGNRILPGQTRLGDSALVRNAAPAQYQPDSQRTTLTLNEISSQVRGLR